MDSDEEMFNDGEVEEELAVNEPRSTVMLDHDYIYSLEEERGGDGPPTEAPTSTVTVGEFLGDARFRRRRVELVSSQEIQDFAMERGVQPVNSTKFRSQLAHWRNKLKFVSGKDPNYQERKNAILETKLGWLDLAELVPGQTEETDDIPDLPLETEVEHLRAQLSAREEEVEKLEEEVADQKATITSLRLQVERLGGSVDSGKGAGGRPPLPFNELSARGKRKATDQLAADAKKVAADRKVTPTQISSYMVSRLSYMSNKNLASFGRQVTEKQDFSLALREVSPEMGLWFMTSHHGIGVAAYKKIKAAFKDLCIFPSYEKILEYRRSQVLPMELQHIVDSDDSSQYLGAYYDLKEFTSHYVRRMIERER